MVIVLATALVLAAAPQGAQLIDTSERARAVRLAREGRADEAIRLFEQIVAGSPADTEARLWIARLDLRLGRTDKAAAGFRAVLADHPRDIDARIGLGSTLTRQGAWREALAVLHDAEREAGDNADLHAALARAHRRAGDDRRALEYFTRARTLSPADPDVVDGYENVARAHGHGIAVEGFGQQLSPGSRATSGTLLATVRATPRLHALGFVRMQKMPDGSDTQAGGGVRWRAGRATTMTVRASGGPDNVALPTSTVSGEVIHYAGRFELGGSIRELSFDGVAVTALSPLLSVDPGGRWRLDARYTYSRSRFAATPEREGDHSVLLRETFRGWRRVWLLAGYAYGIESFEDLTADRVASLGAHTVVGGTRIHLRSLTVIDAAWEHQWRSNESRLDRVTLSVAQFFP